MNHCIVSDLRQTMPQRIKDRQHTILIASIVVGTGILMGVVA